MNQERESNTPEINLYEAARKGTACSFVRDVGDLWRRYADRCETDLEAAREIRSPTARNWPGFGAR